MPGLNITAELAALTPVEHRGRRWFHNRSRRRFWIDLLVLGLASVIAFVASSHFNLFERFAQFSQQHETWQLDEIAGVLILSSLTGGVFALRRSRDLRWEMKSREASEEKIRQLAHHDPLTGLANRRRLREQLSNALRVRKRAEEVTGVLMIDLDRFKPVNDTYGHGVGDRLLKAVADRLQSSVRDGELVARLGGDEFAVLLPRLVRSEEAGRPARRILKGMSAPFIIDQLVLHVGVSVGVAVTAETTADPETLLHHADVALYRAKREARGELRYFQENMDSEIRARARLELELREALTAGAIVPYYHPLVELATGRIRGYEVLARWIHPELGVISPEIFVPIAEDTGMVGEMCLHLLRAACVEARQWEGGEAIAINISPAQLRDSALPFKLLAVLRETGFPATRLEVEITESALVGDFESARKTLVELKSHGAQIALDDFGTGYSSLHHLRQLPVDRLKIDKSFIMSMLESEESRKIVDAIIALGHSLGLITVAEGIETTASLDRLSALGCDMGQGFLYGEPNARIHSFPSAAGAPAEQENERRNTMSQLLVSGIGNA